MKNTLKIALLSAATTLAMTPAAFASNDQQQQPSCAQQQLQDPAASSEVFTLAQIREACATKETDRTDAHKKAIEFAEEKAAELSSKGKIAKGFQMDGLEAVDGLLEGFIAMLVEAGHLDADTVDIPVDEDGNPEDLASQVAGYMANFVQQTTKLTALIDQIAELEADNSLGIITTSSPTSVEILEGLKAYIGEGGGVTLGTEAGDDEEQQQAAQSQALLLELQDIEEGLREALEELKKPKDLTALRTAVQTENATLQRLFEQGKPLDEIQSQVEKVRNAEIELAKAQGAESQRKKSYNPLNRLYEEKFPADQESQ